MIKTLTCLFLLLCPFLSASKYTGPRDEVKAYDSLDAIGQKICKQFQLRLLNISLGHIADVPKAYWGLSFTSSQNLTIDEARPMAEQIAQTLLYTLHHDAAIDKANREVYQKPSTAKPLTNGSIAFKLVFWDANTERPLPPYIAQIRYDKDNIYYYYSNATTQTLQEPIVEPLNQP